MDKLEKLLEEKKSEMKNIKAPDDLEQRLTKALDNKPLKNNRRRTIGKIVAACLIFILIGYNFDTLAFFSKQIVGYNNVMSGTLKELNDLGKGQVIDKGFTFDNGVSINIDGIMLDENQLLIFNTIEAPDHNVDEMMPSLSLEGVVGNYHHRSGRGEVNEEKTSMKKIDSFDSPYFFEKTLTLKLQLNIQGEIYKGKIKFKIDREKAMGHTLKADINQSITLDNTKIQFTTILATPTRTVIRGSIQNIIELVVDEIKGERFKPYKISLELMANGKELNRQGSGMTTDMKGTTFHYDFDPLPKNLQSLSLKLVSFNGEQDVNRTIELEKTPQEIDLMGQKIRINKVYKSEGDTFVNITTHEETLLSKVYLIADEKKLELDRTTEDKYEKLENGKLLHTRTLKFDGTGDGYKLAIEKMRYSKDYNKIINIPLE